MTVMDGGKRISGDSDVSAQVFALFKEALPTLGRVGIES